MNGSSRTATRDASSKSISLTLLITSFLVSSQNAFSIVGLPLLFKASQINDIQLGLLLGAYPLASATIALIAGPVSDIYGRRQLILTGQALLALFLLLHLFSTSFEYLLVVRICAGASAGLLVGLPSTFASDHFEKQTLKIVISRHLFGYALGHTLGIPLGILLLDHIRFEGLSVIIGLLCLAVFYFSLRTLPHPQCPAPSNRDQSNRASALIQGLKERSNRLAMMLSFGSFFANSVFQVSLTLWLLRSMNLTSTSLAPMYLAGGLGQCLLFLLVTHRFNSLGLSKTVSASFAIQAALLLAGPLFLGSFLSAALLFSLALSATALRIPSWHAIVTRRGNPAQKGLRMSLCQSANLVGKSAGVVAGSLLFTTDSAPWLVFGSGFAFAICATIMFFQRSLESPSSLTTSPPKTSSAAPARAIEIFDRV